MTASAPSSAAAGAGNATVGNIDADAVALAVRAVPGVADLTQGTLGEIATYLPGRRIFGVRVRPDLIVVAVTAEFGTSLPVLSTAIRAAVDARAPGVPCDVMIEDIVDPGSAPSARR